MVIWGWCIIVLPCFTHIRTDYNLIILSTNIAAHCHFAVYIYMAVTHAYSPFSDAPILQARLCLHPWKQVLLQEVAASDGTQSSIDRAILHVHGCATNQHSLP